MIFITSENKNKNEVRKAVQTTAFGVSSSMIKKLIVGVGVTAFWIGLWYLLAFIIDKEVILPYPNEVALSLFALMTSSAFWNSCGGSILRIFLGTLLGCIVGILLAALMLSSKSAKALIYPLLSAIKATPVASFIIAALFWISRSDVPSFISFLVVLPLICDAVYTGSKNADVSLIEVADIYRFSAVKRIKYIYIPSAVPYFLSALRTAVGMAWKSGVAAEVLCTPKNSIGKALNSTKVYMETADMFAWTLTVIVLSIAFEKIGLLIVSKGLLKYSTTKEADNAET